MIEKINYNDWGTPIVPVPIRICGDYRVTINPALQVDQYPVPSAEDLFATMASGQKFSKLDLSQAYQQVLYVTINTHKGLYQYNRLPFGVASAPAVLQQTMEKILQGIPVSLCILMTCSLPAIAMRNIWRFCSRSWHAFRSMAYV